MSDIFISYQRKDRPWAEAITSKLKEQGYSVWWDRKIPPGRSFDQVIQEALEKARCIIVLWSKNSIRSDWVKEEAEKGAGRGILVPILIDDVPIPLGFGRIQTANLVGWRGETAHPDFAQVSQSVAVMLGRAVETSRTFQLTAAAASAAGTAGAGAPVRPGPSCEAPAPRPPTPGAPAPRHPTPADPMSLSSASWVSPFQTSASPSMSEARSRRRRRSFRFALLTAALLLSASAGAGLVLLVSDPSPGEVVTAPLPDPAAAGLVSSSPRETAAKRSTAAAQGDLTVLEQLSRWREFRATQPGNRESVRAAARIAELEEIVESSATLTAEAKLVTCEGVALDDGVPTGPVGARDAFRPGMVYVFAWVNSPRESETLKFQWLNESGAVQKTQLATIGRNTAGGYRVFKGKQHPSAGSYQVRLYNQSGDLIGRRAFRVL